MALYDYANRPKAVDIQLESTVCGATRILKDDLVGVYLHGSLAMGAFNVHRSDIDLLIVTTRPLNGEDRREFADLFQRISNRPAPIEVSILQKAVLHPWQYPTPYDFHFSESWRERLAGELKTGNIALVPTPLPTDSDLAAHLTVTRERGVCLEGQPVAEALPSIPPADYRASILEDLQWALERIDTDSVYLVLNICRSMAALQTGAVLSKVEGAEWGMQNLPRDHHILIREALDAITSDTPILPKLDLARVNRLVDLFHAANPA